MWGEDVRVEKGQDVREDSTEEKMHYLYYLEGDWKFTRLNEG